MRGKQVLENMDKSTKPHKNKKGGQEAEETGSGAGIPRSPLCSLRRLCHQILMQWPLLCLRFMVWISRTDNLITDPPLIPGA